MARQGLRITNIHESFEKPECVIKTHRLVKPALDFEGHQGSRFPVAILLRKIIMRTGWEARKMHAFDFVMSQ